MLQKVQVRWESRIESSILVEWFVAASDVGGVIMKLFCAYCKTEKKMSKCVSAVWNQSFYWRRKEM